jgi:GTP-binding protein
VKINQVEFIISAVGPKQYPEDSLPDIALAGRSNVGKSSLINRMIQRKNLARTSSTPGKTQTLNFYRVNKQLYFVDLPGYGYAKVSRTERQVWGKFIERYLRESGRVKLLILIVDLRHPPTADDQSMYDWLKYYHIPVCVVATKADKIPRSRWQRHLDVTAETLKLDPDDSLVMFSSESGLGKDQLWSVIGQAADLRMP